MNNKQKTATVGLLIATVVVIVGAFILFSNKPNNNGSITDRDTGESYDINVNNQRTGGSGDTSDRSSAVLFGIQEFTKTAESNGYEKLNFTTDVRDAISTYSLKNLQDNYDSITLRPQNMSLNEGNITAQLRLGQGDKIIPIDITVVGDGQASLVSIDNGKFIYIGGLNTLDRTLFTISQSDYKGPNITIDSFTYREAALTEIEDLGYNISDLNIKFTNYENPFK